MPEKWQEITIRYTIYCPQTNASYTYISSRKKQDSIFFRWPSSTLLLTEIKSLNLQYLEIISNVTILKITSNHYDKHPYILYEYPLDLQNNFHLEWTIDSTIYNQMKDAHHGKSFESNIQHETWLIKFYPNGYRSTDRPSFFVQLCSLPSFVTKLTVQYALSCTETETTSHVTTDFSYDSSEWNQGDNILSYEQFLQLNASNLTFILDINIIDIVYAYGGSINDYSNNYKWVISDPQMMLNLNSTDESCHWSNMFNIHSFDGWKIQACPEANSFKIFVHLMSKPVEWGEVTARYTINIPQVTIYKFTYIHTFNGEAGNGRPDRTPHPTPPQKLKQLKLDFFEIIVNVTILNIISSKNNQTMLYQYPLVHNKHPHFEWHINSLIIQNLKNKQMVQSDIYNDMFLLNMESKWPTLTLNNTGGIAMLWLQICAMPPNVWKITVQYTFSWDSKFKITDTNEFLYEHPEASRHKIMLIDDFTDLSEIIFVVDIVIIGVVDIFYKNNNFKIEKTEADSVNEFNQQVDEWKNDMSNIIDTCEEILSLIKEEIVTIERNLEQQSDSCPTANNTDHNNNVSVIFIIGSMVTIIVMFITTKYIIYQERVFNINHITNTNKDIMDRCTICMENIRQYACIPCGHLCLCQNCNELINDRCPICNTKCKVVKIFKS
eukprot:125910_1